MMPNIWKFRDYVGNVAQVPTPICDVIKTVYLNLRFFREIDPFTNEDSRLDIKLW